MTDPIRWLEPSSDADRRERELIASGLDAAPPAGAEARIWRSLSITLGQAGGGDGGTSGAEGGTASGATGTSTGAGAAGGASAGLAGSGLSLATLKPLLLGASLGLVVAGGAGQMLSPGPAGVAPISSAMLAVSASAPAVLMASGPITDGGAQRSNLSERSALAEPRTEQASEDELKPVEEVPATSATAAFDAVDGAVTPGAVAPGEPPDRASRLAEEVGLVRDARTHLRRGDPGAALRLLELARVRFPDGALVQEREVLTIEALERTGQVAAARERTRELRRAFPESPHATRLGGPQP